MTDKDEAQPIWVVCNNDKGLAFLRHLHLTGVNAYTKKRDSVGHHLMRLYFDPTGRDSARPRPAPLYIIRSDNGPTFGRAEQIVRDKLGITSGLGRR